MSTVLPKATPEPSSWRVVCPTCEHPIDDLYMTQDDHGAWVVHEFLGDRYPVCEECGVQFQIAPVTSIT